jgi:hypothetical protein
MFSPGRLTALESPYRGQKPTLATARLGAIARAPSRPTGFESLGRRAANCVPAWYYLWHQTAVGSNVLKGKKGRSALAQGRQFGHVGRARNLLVNPGAYAASVPLCAPPAPWLAGHSDPVRNYSTFARRPASWRKTLRPRQKVNARQLRRCTPQRAAKTRRPKVVCLARQQIGPYTD